MQQYTISGSSPRSISILEPLILLGPGYNVFSVFSNSIDSVLALLGDEGFQVHSVNCLSQEPVSVEDQLLPGETPAGLMLAAPNPFNT